MKRLRRTFAEPEPIHVPDWLRAWSSDAETSLDQVAAAMALLALVHPIGRRDRATLPYGVLHERLMLDAVLGQSVSRGIKAARTDLRDEVHRRPAVDAVSVLPVVPSPAAKMFDRLRVGRPVPGPDGSGSNPLAVALRAFDGAADRVDGLLAADAALASCLGWPAALPLVAVGLTRAGVVDEAAIARAVIAGVNRVLRIAPMLERRAIRLRAFAPKLRGRGAEQAVGLLLTRDAIAPKPALIEPGIMPDREARRLCDRLVGLGLARELTGRPTWRLYGL